MNPLRRPRLLARGTSAALVLVAAWLLLVPITVVYVTSDANPVPREIARVYSWWTAEQDLVYSDATGADLGRLDTYLQHNHLANSIRLNCGNVIAAGAHEQLLKPDGPRMCGAVRTRHRFTGLSLLVLGIVGLLVATRLPVEPERYRNRYHQPYSQRRALRRAR